MASKKEQADIQKISEIAYGHAREMIADQKSTLASIRQRATAVTGLSGIAATFLGRAAMGDLDNTPGFTLGSFSIFEWVAIWSLILTVGCTVWLLLPRKWSFLMGPLSILNQFVYSDAKVTLEETLLALSVFSEENYAANEKKLKAMFIVLNIAFILLFLQILGWLISLR